MPTSDLKPTSHAVVKAAQEIENLLTRWQFWQAHNTGWRSRLFPSKLAMALTQYRDSIDKNIYPVYQAYLEGTWFFQRWLPPRCLQLFSQTQLVHVLQVMYAAGLLSGTQAITHFNDAIEMIEHVDAELCAQKLEDALHYGLLSDVENFAAIKEDVCSFHDMGMVFKLHYLQAMGLLQGEVAQQNRIRASTLSRSSAIWYCYIDGICLGPRAQETFENLALSASPEDTWRIYFELRCLYLTPEVRDDYLHHRKINDSRQCTSPSTDVHYPSELTDLLCQADEAARDLRNRALQHADLKSLGLAYTILREGGYFTGAEGLLNANAMIELAQPDHVARTLKACYKANLLSDSVAAQNRTMIFTYPHPKLLSFFSEWLLTAKLLNQRNFNTMIAEVNLPTLAGMSYSRIPESRLSRLTQAHFNWFMDLCRTAEDTIIGAQNFSDYIDEVFLTDDQTYRRTVSSVINPTQSTHTASVHRSVSASAIKLKTRYLMSISINDLSGVLNQLSESLFQEKRLSLTTQILQRNWRYFLHKFFRIEYTAQDRLMAAKRCFIRFTAFDYDFTDPVSDLSTQALLGLIARAMHDESCRKGTLQDAVSAMIEALYQCQRGYNLSDTFIDNRPSLIDQLVLRALLIN